MQLAQANLPKTRLALQILSLYWPLLHPPRDQQVLQSTKCPNQEGPVSLCSWILSWKVWGNSMPWQLARFRAQGQAPRFEAELRLLHRIGLVGRPWQDSRRILITGLIDVQHHWRFDRGFGDLFSSSFDHLHVLVWLIPGRMLPCLPTSHCSLAISRQSSPLVPCPPFRSSRRRVEAILAFFSASSNIQL